MGARLLRTSVRVGALALTAVACGPSLTTVHEGTIRFEHCYRMDLEPRASAAQRHACWQLWVGSYTLGQPRDRTDYALHRLHAFDDKNAPVPELTLGGEPRPEERQFYLVVPGPTSVHATPPPIATVVQTAEALDSPDGGLPPSERAKTGEGKEPPSASCATSCQSDWQSCESACTAGKSAECATCKSTYSKCMRHCFE